MSNIQLIGEDNIEIPVSFRKLKSEELVQKDDQVCFLSISKITKPYEFSITWLKPSVDEVGLRRRFVGEIVIRKN